MSQMRAGRAAAAKGDLQGYLEGKRVAIAAGDRDPSRPGLKDCCGGALMCRGAFEIECEKPGQRLSLLLKATTLLSGRP